MSKIKICGLKREEDISFINIAKPDFAGFVFAGTKRKIDFNTADRFRNMLDKNIQSAGVFVNEKIDNIVKLCKQGTISLVQLHGDEDEEYIKDLKEKIKITIVKVIKVSSKICNIDRIDTKADFILFDSFSADEYGGSGKSFDWDLIKNCSKPFFIAGGINKNNIKEVEKKLNPYCIDLSSGVETDGVKDLKKIIEIVNIARKK
jgi:phosphoribosylanthranilate isomerase